ncbi:MAG: FKBP-type peptidyl-prolyl cis-trans isomerase, partial [Polaromonas sp.]
MRSILCTGVLSVCLSSAAWAQSDAAAAAAAKQAGASVTASALDYRALKPRTRAAPAASDTVQVQYRGRFPCGTE